MMKDTSYSKIPSNYGLCAADCPRGDTCLRRIAYDRIPANVVFPPTLHLYRLIGSWGVRRYYQKRKGETLLSPAEQQQVVALARKLGVRLDEYFDGYVEEYDW